MKFLYVLLFLLPLSIYTNSENTFSGVVIDKITGEPLPYVKVGTAKDTSVLTNKQGQFKFTIPYKTDTIKFVKPGYYPKKSVVSGGYHSDNEIALKPIREDVSSNKTINCNDSELQGYDYFASNTMVDFPSNTKGGEMALVIGEPNKRTRIKKVYLYISVTKVKTPKFRINLYSFQEENTGSLINKKEIIDSCTIEQDIKLFNGGWISFNLEKYNLTFKDRALLSIENIFYKNIEDKIVFGSPTKTPNLFKKSKIYVRLNPLSKFRDTKLTSSFYVKICSN